MGGCDALERSGWTTAQAARPAHSADGGEIRHDGKGGRRPRNLAAICFQAIADVEHAIGLRLLDRGSHGIEPTIYGRALLKCGAAVFDELRQGVKALEFLTDPTGGELWIGSNETVAAGFVSAVVDRVARQYPRLAFHLVPADPSTPNTLLNNELRQRTVELGVMALPGMNLGSDVSVEVLFEDRHVAVAHVDSKWSRRHKLRLAEVVHEPWVLPPPDSIPGRRIAQAFHNAGLEPPHPQMTSFSLTVHHHLLATGRFLTMLPLSMLRFDKHLPLKSLPVETSGTPFPTGIVTLKNRTLSPVAQLFIDCAREVAKGESTAVTRGAANGLTRRPPAQSRRPRVRRSGP